VARVLCISSQTVFGPVGNSAAVPALQSRGLEVMQIPTVLLSNHPGLAKPAGQSTAVSLIEAMFQALTDVNAFFDIAAVMTGYFVSAAQVIAVTKQISTLKRHHEHLQVLVDPVIGDHGKLYVGEDVAEAIRNQLMPLATIATPNLFELQWLTCLTDVKAAVAKLAVAETIVTSLPMDDNQLATELHVATTQLRHIIKRHPHVPNGTGDFLAGCYLSERLSQSASAAFPKAMLRVEQAILKSLGSPTLKLS
jgi:pyridoxine kinase